MHTVLSLIRYLLLLKSNKKLLDLMNILHLDKTGFFPWSNTFYLSNYCIHQSISVVCDENLGVLKSLII